MAEDSREIRYYKGKPYYIIEKVGEHLLRLQDTSQETVTKLVEKNNIETEEEFKKRPRPSTHVNWIK